jgi:four helix bundle protein
MKIRSYKELDVYKLAFNVAMSIYQETKKFPAEEKYSMVDQIRRSSRSVCANISEAFRTRQYEKNFVSKLTIASSEASETQTWLDFSLACGYINQTQYDEYFDEYDHIIAMLVNMIRNAGKWVIPTS